MKKRMPTTKAQLIKAWNDAKSKERANYIAFCFENISMNKLVNTSVDSFVFCETRDRQRTLCFLPVSLSSSTNKQSVNIYQQSKS